MRQAAIALLAVPILVAVYLGALLRRSTLARVGLALGLAFVLGDRRPRHRPAVDHGRHPDRPPIVPLDPGGVHDDRSSTDRGLDRAGHARVQRRRWTRVGRRRPLKVEPATPVDLSLGRDRARS